MKTASLLFLLSLFSIHSTDAGAQTRHLAKVRRSSPSNILATSSSSEGSLVRAKQRAASDASSINQDQQRLRENIKALTSTVEAKQLVARYVGKADQQESRLDQLEQERRATVEERARLQLELDSAIRSLWLDRKLD